jgi:hypothetical protein
VTKRSGGSCHIHRRYCCPKFHRQSFHEYAKESVLWSRWAGAYYLQQRTKGCPHHTAVRALAFKWQRIIWRCWQDRKPYEEAKYEAALRQAKSPLVALFENRLSDYLRGELSDPAHETPRLQPRRSRRVRCSAWLALHPPLRRGNNSIS